VVSASAEGRIEDSAAIGTSVEVASGALSMTEGSSMPIIEGGGAFARRFNNCSI
jgi:hypothetical protein